MKVFIIAGPNGAGKTTFAKFFLKNYPDIKHYLNADILASGIAP
jgi:predicted ABC-type ATPase